MPKPFYQENHFNTSGKSLCGTSTTRLTKYKTLVTCKLCLKKLSNEKASPEKNPEKENG